MTRIKMEQIVLKTGCKLTLSELSPGVPLAASIDAGAVVGCGETLEDYWGVRIWMEVGDTAQYKIG